MSFPARCETCHRNTACQKIGKYDVCLRCIGIYNEVKTLVLEASHA